MGIEVRYSLLAALLLTVGCSTPTAYTDAHFKKFWSKNRYVPISTYGGAGVYIWRGDTLTLFADSTFRLSRGYVVYRGRYAWLDEVLELCHGYLDIEAIPYISELWIDDSDIYIETYGDQSDIDFEIGLISPLYAMGDSSELFLIRRYEYDQLRWDPGYIWTLRAIRDESSDRVGLHAYFRQVPSGGD